MYGNSINLINLGNGTFAVKKELLPPKYYKNYPGIMKLPENQMTVKGIKFVVMPAENIIDDVDRLLAEHPMDNYHYPMDNGTYGNYSGKQPYPHQIYTSRFLIDNWDGRGAHVHNSMGLGKSLSCLWTTDFLLRTQRIQKVLIVAPKVVMRSAWLKEINTEMLWLSTALKTGVARGRVTDAQIDIINHDGLTAELLKHKRQVGARTFYDFQNCPLTYDLIIYDECTALKTTKSQRHKVFSKWFDFLHSRNNTKLWMLTGTPVSQSPIDAYGIAKLISPESVPTSVTKWREMTMYTVDKLGFKWEARDNALEMCAKVLNPSVRFELKDSTDLPDHQFIFVPVEKTKRQKELFKEMSRDFIATISEDKQIVAANGAAKLSKLLQLLSGCIYDEDRNTHLVESTNKLEALKEIIDQLPEEQPIVIFCDFTHVQEYLFKELQPIYNTVEVINGSVKADERSQIVQRVLDCKTKVVIAHTVTTALGVDFVSTNVLVYYTPTNRNELYLQSLDRIRRLSSVERGFTSFLIYHIIADPIEQRVYEGLHDKTKDQNAIFEMIRDELMKGN